MRPCPLSEAQAKHLSWCSRRRPSSFARLYHEEDEELARPAGAGSVPDSSSARPLRVVGQPWLEPTPVFGVKSEPSGASKSFTGFLLFGCPSSTNRLEFRYGD